MKPETAIERKTNDATTSPYVVEAEKLLERMRDLSQNVARRAYEFFEARGGEIGNALDDWFRAESELLRHVPIEVVESETQFKVRAEVPGFKPEEIKVSVEPRQVIISGESVATVEEAPGSTVYSERRSHRFCRTIELPSEVVPGNANAALNNGVLELTCVKQARVPATNVEVKAV